LLRGRDVQELKELQRQGMSIRAISELTGWDRKTIRKYMQAAGVTPEYGPRPAQPSKLDAFKPYLEERLRAGVWNARVLLRELREQAQVDWGHLGTLEIAGQEQKLHGFTFTLGYSRRMVAEAALDQKLGTLLRLHEAAFQQIGGVLEEILYDRMKTVNLQRKGMGSSGLFNIDHLPALEVVTVPQPDRLVHCENT
jgi:transposase